MEKREHDPLLLDGKHRRLDGRYKVRVDLSELTRTELEHLRSGIYSTLENRERGGEESKCWHVPAHAVEVFVAK